MKKLLMVAGGLMFTTMTFAQVDLGAKVGLNYSIYGTSVDPEPEEKPESASGVGFHLGAYLQYNLSDMIGIRPELLFSSRGFQSDETSTSVNTFNGITTTTETKSEDKSSYTYLEIPLLLAISPSENFSIHVGPGFGLLMGGKVKSEGETTTTVASGGTSTTTTASYSAEFSGSDVTEGARGMELGAIVGFAYELESGLNFGLRYWRGLSTLNEETEFGPVTVKTNANVIQFSIGYTFIKG